MTHPVKEVRMARHQVTCVNTARSWDDTHQHITHLGLGTAQGYYGRITVAEAVAQLRSPSGDQYYTVSPSTGMRADIVEAGCEICGQRPHVKTTADRVHDNNLLHLPYCRLA